MFYHLGDRIRTWTLGLDELQVGLSSNIVNISLIFSVIVYMNTNYVAWILPGHATPPELNC